MGATHRCPRRPPFEPPVLILLILKMCCKKEEPQKQYGPYSPGLLLGHNKKTSVRICFKSDKRQTKKTPDWALMVFHDCFDLSLFFIVLNFLNWFYHHSGFYSNLKWGLCDPVVIMQSTALYPFKIKDIRPQIRSSFCSRFSSIKNSRKSHMTFFYHYEFNVSSSIFLLSLYNMNVKTCV